MQLGSRAHATSQTQAKHCVSFAIILLRCHNARPHQATTQPLQHPTTGIPTLEHIYNRETLLPAGASDIAAFSPLVTSLQLWLRHVHAPCAPVTYPPCTGCSSFSPYRFMLGFDCLTTETIEHSGQKNWYSRSRYDKELVGIDGIHLKQTIHYYLLERHSHSLLQSRHVHASLLGNSIVARPE